jgi:hypothetical protein
MTKMKFFAFILISLALVFGACGGDGGDQPAKAEKTKTVSKDQGVEVAKAILATFDQAVAEAYEVVKDKPEASEVKDKLKAIIADYTLKMQELNKKYLALKTADIATFGAANGYLGENRGKHVFAMGAKLDSIRYHYQKLEDPEMDGLVHGDLIKLLDKAVER